MARRVFLHVGTPKSGTSYLQGLWWHHRDALAERGLLLPGDALADHFHAASLVTDRDEVVERLTPAQRRTWERLLGQVGAWDRDVLISHELFAPATAERAGALVRRLGGVAEEVHVVVTARDLARQLPSGWQQNVKQGRTATFREFWEEARDRADAPFWDFQDVPAILDRWTAEVAPDRRHLVVLPPPGAPRHLLWERVCDLLGVSAAGLDLEIDRANESLGLGEVELVRRVHATVPEERRGLDVRRVATNWFTRRVLAPDGSAEPFVVPADLHRWAVERGTELVAALRQRDLHVVGALDDLVPDPTPPTGRTPDSVTDADVAAVAVAALTRVLLGEVERRQQRRG